jgi:hypothetical protein
MRAAQLYHDPPSWKTQLLFSDELGPLDDGLHPVWRRPIRNLQWETARQIVAMGREMKVVLVCVLVLIAAATALAYGRPGVGAEVTAVVSRAWDEPAALLLFGSALLGIGGVIRRMPF